LLELVDSSGKKKRKNKNDEWRKRGSSTGRGGREIVRWWA